VLYAAASETLGGFGIRGNQTPGRNTVPSEKDRSRMLMITAASRTRGSVRGRTVGFYRQFPPGCCVSSAVVGGSDSSVWSGSLGIEQVSGFDQAPDVQALLALTTFAVGCAA